MKMTEYKLVVVGGEKPVSPFFLIFFVCVLSFEGPFPRVIFFQFVKSLLSTSGSEIPCNHSFIRSVKFQCRLLKRTRYVYVLKRTQYVIILV